MSQTCLGKRLPTIVLLLSAACVFAQSAPMVEDAVTQKIADGVYIIPDGRVNLVPNIGILVGERGVMVVDTGMGPANAERVLREVRKVTSKDVLYLTITHFHPEHGMGAQSFPQGTRIVVPKEQKEELAAKGADYIKMFSGFSPQIAELLKPVKLVSPDIAFEHELEIDLGGGMLVRLLHYAPAHTRGDNLVWLPNQRILFGGDVVVDRFFPIMPDVDASPRGWLEALDKLEQLGPATVVPGHGAVGNVAQIRALREYLGWLRGRVQELAAQGKSSDQVVAALSPEVEARYKDWDNPNWIKNAIERTYAELSKP